MSGITKDLERKLYKQWERDFPKLHGQVPTTTERISDLLRKRKEIDEAITILENEEWFEDVKRATAKA